MEQDLSEAFQQNMALKQQFQDLERQHGSQITIYTESIEFLEQENRVCREQVSETESQLKANLFALRERNLQCETQKDKIDELLKEINELQMDLHFSKKEAQNMQLKMGKELSDSSTEVSGIKENVQKLTERIRDAIQGEVSDTSCLRTPSRSLSFSDSLVGSVLKARLEEQTSQQTVWFMDSENKKIGRIWSETSAFSVVRPVISQAPGDSEVHLPDALRELNDFVLAFANSSSKAIEIKQQIIKDLNREIFFLRDELQNRESQYKSEIRELKEDQETLQRQNHCLNEALNRKQQCIRELEDIVQQQEQRILHELRKTKEREEVFEENAMLKRSLHLSENEVNLLKEEMAKNQAYAAQDWIQEKLMLHKDLTNLRLMLIDTENAKSEIVHRSLKHRDILERNLANSEKELKKLDDIIEKIRATLLSIPEVVSSNENLKKVMAYLK
ncbi:Hypothetical predicted protein [Pelobates cultripes]|uniref:Uncharacterized protein n=1 Tax=Pelobates cultripes TaxID=61616 RepID=A0AAD1VMC4_PELCU|nr:Hypothetical predicted protein [Pelobates cultripes]